MFTGYISVNTLTVVSTLSGAVSVYQYLEANGTSLAVGTKIVGSAGGGVWLTNGSPQTIGSAANPVTFTGYGPLTNQTDANNAAVNNTGGWVNVQNDLQSMTTSIRTPMISFLSPLQLANVLFASNISALVGTLGTQSDTAVNILGGTIDGTVIGGTTPAAGNFTQVSAVGVNASLGMNTLNYDAAGFAYRLRATASGTNAIIQWTNNAQTVQWTSLIGSNNLLQCSTPFQATSFTGSGSGLTTLPTINNQQVLTNYSGAKTAGSVYSNLTGRPIVVIVTAAQADGGLYFYINGVVMGFQGQSGGSGNDYHCISMIVPTGSTYQVAYGNGNASSIPYWWEIR